ncbi:MAG: hypothetical protein AAB871_00415 [Patescibacteria group bacterium]
MKKFKSRYKICVSGAAGGKCIKLASKLAEEVGRAVARNGAILTTGATTGIPQSAARGAKKAGGMVFGFSPAQTRREHIKKYRLPLEYHDAIIYTGSGYAGRNLMLTRSSDAVIVVCGRIGTLNEFTVAFEDRKVIGVLKGSGGITVVIPDILEMARRVKKHIIMDSNPQRLVAEVLKRVKHVDAGKS